MTEPCTCLQCSLRRLALEHAADEAEALACMSIALGRMLAAQGEETFKEVIAEISRSRTYYRDEAAKSVSRMEVAGHA